MNNEVLNYLDEQSKENIVRIEFDGGNDEGCLSFYIGDKEIDYYQRDTVQHSIVNTVADYLGYGSFAGDFYVRGEVVYNRETKCFEGSDLYSYSDYKEASILEFDPLVIEVPLDVPFDIVDITVDMDRVEGSFLVTNGPFLPDLLMSTSEKIFSDLQDAYKNVIDGLSDEYPGLSFVENLDHNTINRREFVVNEKKGVREYRVQSIGFSVETEEENAYSISFTD